MNIDPKKPMVRSQKPSGGNLASRVRRLEDMLEEIKDALEPSEMNVVFHNPKLGQPKPNPDDQPKGTIIVTIESPYEIKELDPATKKEMAAEFDARIAEREAERQAEIDRMTEHIPKSAPPPGGAHAHFGERVIAEGYGWRWGVQAPIQHRFKGSKNMNPGMQALSRSGII
jgi:hypothetical protein